MNTPSHELSPARFALLRAHALALLCAVLLTLVLLPLRDRLTLANVTMFFLLSVVLVATMQGISPALVTTFASFFSINFFFVPPYYTLTVSDPREVLDLIVFLIVAMIAGRLGAYSRQQAETARRHAREGAILLELERKSRRFEEADRLKTALLHAVSHDLRTPITIIKTSASNLRQLGQKLAPHEQVELAETIETEADQLDRLVGNLLDMSRLKAGALTLSVGLNSLEEIAGDVAARAWQLTKQERLRIQFPDDMPLVEFDYGLILQAVTNLVDNALRYEPPASQVELRGAAQPGLAFFKIINHGETIDAETKAHMMEPFFRGKDGKIGLGLPIAKGIIEAHRGELRVEDTPGSGATFVIALPIQEVTHLEAQDTGRG
jgi:two-component system sensor histidine kinase KdpD